MRTKSTKHSLLFSALSLLLCVSMFATATFAWFTDSVTSGNNMIVSGTLDVEMEYFDGVNWTPVGESTKLFDEEALWEPGYTQVAYLRVSNAGNLALKYQFGISVGDQTGSINVNGKRFMLSDHIKFGVLPGVQTPYASREEARSAVTTALSLNEGYVSEKPLLPGDEPDYMAVVVYMPEEVGNEANTAVGAEIPQIDLGVKLVATQHTYESDSFGTDYDAAATLPAFQGTYTISVAAPPVDENNQTLEAVTIGGPGSAVTAEVPAGVKVVAGTEQLVLTVNTTKRSGNIDMEIGEVSRSLDVHIEGIDSSANEVPVTVHLGSILPVGYNDSSVKLYHVENEIPKLMDNVDDFDEHNQYNYTSATGEVSIYIKSFSEITAVVAAGNPWDGDLGKDKLDISWYNSTEGSYTISNEAQLAGLGAIVGGMIKDSEGNTIQDSFEGKTVKLGADLNLGGKVWYPIGYYNSTGSYERTSAQDVKSDLSSFEGTFDGDNHTISNIYQNTWDMFGDYNNGYPAGSNYYKDGMGLFGFVYNGTVKDLIIDNFQSDGEFCTTGCVAAYASGASTFENITITNSNPRAYNVPNGGVVGYAYDEDGANNVINFNNVKVDSSNKISALWGSWDVGCGGILGRVNGDTTVNMTNCEVGAVIDVYNDVCGNYQYYQYRYAGMLIGTVGADGNPKSGAEKVNFSNVKVYIGNWADYYYCEFEKNSQGSYTDDFQFSRVEKDEINFNPNTNMPDFEGTPCLHEHTANEDKMGLYLPFDQIYTGYGWGATPVRGADGVTVERSFYSIIYKDALGKEVLDVEYVTEGERSENRLWADSKAITKELPDSSSTQKFNGWVNSGSVKVDKIPAGNRNDVVLFASWTNPYTVRFVDQFGNVIHSETFTTNNPTVSVPLVPEVQDCIGVWEDYNLKNAKGDITVRPIYTYGGKLKLTPVDDPKDGVIDYYQVDAVAALDETTYIPGYFNGLPVKVVNKLYDNNGNLDYGSGVKTIIIGEGVEELHHNSLAYTSDLETVKLPSTIKMLEKNTFSRNWGDDKKVLTIEFNGTMADWETVDKKEDWYNGLKEGSVVKCSDGYYELYRDWGDWGKWKWRAKYYS